MKPMGFQEAEVCLARKPNERLQSYNYMGESIIERNRAYF